MSRRSTLELCREIRALLHRDSRGDDARDPALEQSLDALEARLADESAAAQRDLLAHIFATAPLPLAHFSVDGQFARINARFEQVFGYTADDVRSLDDWYERAYPDPAYRREVRASSADAFESAVATDGRVPARERSVTTKDGTVVTGFMSGARFGNDVMVSFFDTTELRKTEASLRESERRYRFIAESASDVIWVTDLDTSKLVYVSPSVESLLGYGVADVMAQGMLATLTPASKESAARQIADRIAAFAAGGSEVYIDELEHVRGDGERVSTETSVHYIRNDASGHLEAHSTSRDITARKRAAAEKADLEAQLQHARRLEAIGTLAGGVAHDFNNVLQVIVMCGHGALAELRAGEPVADMVQEILDASTSAAALTRQLLSFSRRQVIQPKVVDVNDVVASLGKMLQRLIGENISVETLLEPQLARTFIDVGQLEQCIINLAVNARDAMPSGGRLVLRTANIELGGEANDDTHAPPRRYITLSVEDNGCGMPQATLERVFEPFFTTKAVGEGTGLGLATTHGAVVQAGGKIEVSSEVGRGTTVRIYLPRTDVPVAKVMSVASVASVAALQGDDTLLLVEDDEQVRRATQRVLERLGYRVLCAHSGQHALEISASYAEEIDLLMTDVVMPGLDGAALADELVATRPGLRVLFTSGYAAQTLERRDSAHSGRSFIGKPFTAVEIALKLREILGTVR